MESIVVALSPFVLNAVMAAVKWLAGNNTFSVSGKRGFLALFSLIGVICFHALSGTEINPNSITDLTTVIVESFVAFVLSHGSYKLFWDPPKK